MNNNIALEFKNDSYYLNHLSSPDISTWNTTGGPINKTIKNIDLNKNQRRTVERT